MIGIVYCAQAKDKIVVQDGKVAQQTLNLNLECFSPLKLKLKNKNIYKKCQIYI